MTYVRPRARRTVVAFVATIASLTAACGDDTATTSPTKPTDPPRSSSATSLNVALSDQDLAAAAGATTAFLDHLGRGRIDEALALLGPVSEANADAAGGARSLLQVSTEGHGAWAGAADRAVTPLGIDSELVVVVLEGTLRVEGMVEHRVAAFPVRRAGSAGTWLVELWGTPVAEPSPLVVTVPMIEPDGRAAVPIDAPGPFAVRVRSRIAGTLSGAVGAEQLISRSVAAGEEVGFEVPIDAALVTLVVVGAEDAVHATAFTVAGRSSTRRRAQSQ